MFTRHSWLRRLLPVLCCLPLVPVAPLCGVAHAATFIVTSTADPGGACTPGGGPGCTLRAAVTAANNVGGNDVIAFDPAIFAVPRTITLGGTKLPLIAGNLTINGPGARLLTISGNHLSNIFVTSAAVANLNFTLNGLTLADGNDFTAGAIYNNHATVTLNNCTLSGNHCSIDGGAITNDGSQAGSATLTLNNCTLSGNSSTSGGAIDNDGIQGGNGCNATAILNNCTLSGNTSSNDGGAISSDGFKGTANLTLTNCTLSDNAAPGYGGGIYNLGVQGTANLTLGNTVFNAGASGVNVTNRSGTVISAGHNLSSDHTGPNGLTDRLNRNPRLGPLANNGGPTQTHALLLGSPAIDTGSTALLTDQRGYARPQGAADDIGAFEAESLTLTPETADEGDSGTSLGEVTLSLAAPALRDVTVEYRTANSTALAGQDYTAVPPTSATIPAGQISVSLNVPVLGDTLNEADETVKVLLSNPGGPPLAAFTALMTILNDDPLPLLAVDSPLATEGDSGTVPLTFNITLSAPSGRTVLVNFNLTGTATAGVDYTYNGGLARTFLPGQTSKTVTVAVVGDTLIEGDETVKLHLTSAGHAGFANSLGLGTIVDNEAKPALSINDVTQAEGTSSDPGSFTFTVTLAAVSGQTVTVHYATADGTATKPGDYAFKAGTLTFAPGETTKTVLVTVNGDAAVEANETFFVNLSSPVNATIADGQGVGIITNDD